MPQPTPEKHDAQNLAITHNLHMDILHYCWIST